MRQECHSFAFSFGKNEDCQRVSKELSSPLDCAVTVYQNLKFESALQNETRKNKIISVNKFDIRYSAQDNMFLAPHPHVKSSFSPVCGSIYVNIHIPTNSDSENMCELTDTGSTSAFQYYWSPGNERKLSSANHRYSLKLVKTALPESFLQTQSSEITKYDRILGQYEGGFKVWDCSADVAAFFLDISRNIESMPRGIATLFDEMCNKSQNRILDLGCGQGLCGLAVACALDTLVCKIGLNPKSISITMQDYDAIVIEEATLQNITESFHAHSLLSAANFTFLACPWSDFTSFQEFKIENVCSNAEISLFDPFDLILGSDILFSKESCESVATVLVNNAIAWFQKAYLSEQLGQIKGPIAIIGTKKHYFGTNGGLCEFEAFLAILTKHQRKIRPLANGRYVHIILRPETTILWQNDEKDRLIVCVTFEIVEEK